MNDNEKQILQHVINGVDLEILNYKCDYVGIEKFYKNNDYVTYNCNKDIDGKIGFMIDNGNGYIRYFRNKKE